MAALSYTDTTRSGGRTGGERLILLLTLFRKATNRLLTVCVCVYVYILRFLSFSHMCACVRLRMDVYVAQHLGKPAESLSPPLKLELQITVSFLIRVSEMTPGLLQEQPILS